MDELIRDLFGRSENYNKASTLILEIRTTAVKIDRIQRTFAEKPIPSEIMDLLNKYEEAEETATRELLALVESA